ncbi:MAG: hypothetical protein AB1716_16990 [Planctomycetota bacterium]
MPENNPQPPPGEAPYGAAQPRPAWPLVTLLALFALWFCFLIWMAVQYPAR